MVPLYIYIIRSDGSLGVDLKILSLILWCDSKLLICLMIVPGLCFFRQVRLASESGAPLGVRKASSIVIWVASSKNNQYLLSLHVAEL